ncbi:MAG: potassium channel protein [Atopostipes sp.]|nr:potassium channel protein [Atopostipes sp.]
MSERKNNITILISLIVTIVLTGTIGYKILLDTNFVDALYMTVITISTVGYGEIAEMDVEAKLFSIVLIFTSLGTVSYLFSSLVSSLLEGDLKKAWRRRNMEKEIEKIKNHYIICGAGQTGYQSIDTFKEKELDFVVIDKSEEVVDNLVEEGVLAILGEASEEEVLEKANIADAKGLITTLPKDADNVYTILTARPMNEEMYIVSRAINKNATEKLKKAGADNTISPNEIGGSRMASLMIRPNVMSFLDVITRAGDVILDLEEVEIHAGSDLINKELKESQIPQKTGLIILAIKKRESEDLSFNPSSSEKLEKGDAMIVLGQSRQVDELRKMAKEEI